LPFRIPAQAAFALGEKPKNPQLRVLDLSMLKDFGQLALSISLLINNVEMSVDLLALAEPCAWLSKGISQNKALAFGDLEYARRGRSQEPTVMR
jgi:hypothetical protein